MSPDSQHFHESKNSAVPLAVCMWGRREGGTILFCSHWEILPAFTLLDKSIKGS